MKGILVLLITMSTLTHGQSDENSELFISLKTQDSVFFERGFNQCDIEFLNKTIAADLKFYHDQGGIQNKEQFLENTRKYICGDLEKKPIRKLKKGSLVIFPLYNNGELYGVIQKGVHNFYLREHGKKDEWTSTAKFTHVWVLENGSWILSEVLSYDHQDPSSGK